MSSPLTYPLTEFFKGRLFIIPLLPSKTPEEELEKLLPPALAEAIRGRYRLLEEEVFRPLLFVRNEEEFGEVFRTSSQKLFAMMVAIAIEISPFFLEKPKELLKILETLSDLPAPTPNTLKLSREDKKMVTISLRNIEKGFLAVILLFKMLLNQEELEESKVEEFFVKFLETLLSFLAVSYRFSSRKRPKWRGLVSALCGRAFLSSRRMGALALQLGLLRVAPGVSPGSAN